MRRLLIVPMGLLVLTVVGFILGSAAQLPFVLVLSLLCVAPLFLLTLGYAFGKASNRYSFFVPKDSQPVINPARHRRPASSYEVNAGDLRGT